MRFYIEMNVQISECVRHVYILPNYMLCICCRHCRWQSSVVLYAMGHVPTNGTQNENMTRTTLLSITRTGIYTPPPSTQPNREMCTIRTTQSERPMISFCFVSFPVLFFFFFFCFLFFSVHCFCLVSGIHNFFHFQSNNEDQTKIAATIHFKS